mgnify:CR=1 FL=1|uniref:Uncharacterized protein n=1 Tax=viral metagenome TaxID=1070528 RepID=A0A6C0J1Q6_9ZZZZ
MNSSAIASNPIFAAIFDKNYEPTMSVINKHTQTIAGLISDKGLTIMPDLSDNEDSEQIQDIISNYIRMNMTKKDINAFICEYGISNSMKLFHDFQKIGLNSPYIEICEILATEDYGLEKEIVELIIKDSIGFESNWRITGDGVVKTINQEDIVEAFKAHSIECA